MKRSDHKPGAPAPSALARSPQVWVWGTKPCGEAELGSGARDFVEQDCCDSVMLAGARGFLIYTYTVIGLMCCCCCCFTVVVLETAADGEENAASGDSQV
uniref:Uncharacterized protein n=1 Tax=Calcidiscus leptoporus TaxID=127549 RepID=A0A6U5LVX7_9EUKA|mmetsp:Transcript_5156/g.11798  ORF Transcript_5156/g.11798 Transcript_5156/m.11798 type:complete len:100 (+) Transcript_5156:870-1169(+)